MLESNALGCDESLVIEPIPGYVVKVNADDIKLFINICSSEKVESSGTCSEMFRIPMSIGPVSRDVDKRGRSCNVIDIVVSPDIVRESLVNAAFRDKLHGLVFDSIEKKHSIKLKSEWKIINKKYQGEKVRPQCIRYKRETLIEEITDPLHEPKSQKDDFRDVLFTMIYSDPELRQSVDLLDLIGSDEKPSKLKDGSMCDFSEKPSTQSCKKNLDEVLSHMTICDVSILNIHNPGLYKIRVSSQRLHVTKTGMNRKEFNIWFPKIMDHTCVVAKYDKEARKILLSIKSKDA